MLTGKMNCIEVLGILSKNQDDFLHKILVL